MASLSEFDIDALISFTSTTVDDFAVMLYFFSLAELKHDVERSRSYVSILVSFFIGYTIVGAVALLSLLFGLVLTREYIALAGFIPLTAGIHKVYESLVEKGIIAPFSCCGATPEGDDTTGITPQNEGVEQGNKYISVSIRDRTGSSSSSDSADVEEGAARPSKSVEMTATRRHHDHSESSACDTGTSRNPMTSSARKHKVHGKSDSDSSSDDEYDISGPVQASINSVQKKFLGMFTWPLFWQHYRDPINWEVLAITLASGSDHVVIYNAMMELETAGWQILVTVGVYYVILVVHTVCAVWLIRCKLIAQIFQDYSILLIICLMIGTGVYILKDSVIFVKPGTAAAESAAAAVA